MVEKMKQNVIDMKNIVPQNIRRIFCLEENEEINGCFIVTT